MIGYLALPNYSFPIPPPDSIQSEEPADLESPLRRGYFTNFERAEILSWYKTQFDHSSFLNLGLPTVLLNYPPENAQTLIRDQTGSTFLQEFAHPFRESFYINGFETPENYIKPIFFVGGQTWQQKIIIRFIPTSIWVRELVFIASAVMIAVVYNSFEKLLKKNDK